MRRRHAHLTKSLLSIWISSSRIRSTPVEMLLAIKTVGIYFKLLTLFVITCQNKHHSVIRLNSTLTLRRQRCSNTFEKNLKKKKQSRNGRLVCLSQQSTRVSILTSSPFSEKWGLLYTLCLLPNIAIVCCRRSGSTALYSYLTKVPRSITSRRKEAIPSFNEKYTAIVRMNIFHVYVTWVLI